MFKKKDETPLHLRLGRVALSSVLAASMGAGALAMPSIAFADSITYENGTFTIESKDNAEAVYDVYRLFSADISQNVGADPDFPASEYPVESWPGIAKQMSWNDAAKSTVLAFLDANGYKAWITSVYGVAEGTAQFAFEREVPQNAAEYIAEQIGASNNDADAATVPATKAEKTFALNIARALANAGVSSQATTLNGEGDA